MKTFKIASWMWNAEKPNETAVAVDVVTEVAPGIQQSTRYEFALPERFETLNDEFMAAVQAMLAQAGLI